MSQAWCSSQVQNELWKHQLCKPPIEPTAEIATSSRKSRVGSREHEPTLWLQTDLYFTSFSGKDLNQAASFLLNPGFQAFLPSPRFLRVIRLNRLCCFQVCPLAKMMPATKWRRTGKKYGTGVSISRTSEIIVVPKITTMSLEGSLAVFIWGIRGVYAIFSHLLYPFCGGNKFRTCLSFSAPLPRTMHSTHAGSCWLTFLQFYTFYHKDLLR